MKRLIIQGTNKEVQAILKRLVEKYEGYTLKECLEKEYPKMDQVRLC